MPLIAGAILGGAAIAGGASVASGVMGSQSAKEQAAIGNNILLMGQQQAQNQYYQGLSFLQPYFRTGNIANQYLSNAWMGQGEMQNQLNYQISDIDTQLAELKKNYPKWTNPGEPFEGYSWVMKAGPGPSQSERAGQLNTAAVEDWKRQVAELEKQRSQLVNQREYFEKNQANTGSMADVLEASPAYKLTNELTSRRLAALGLQGSDEAIRQQGYNAALLLGDQMANYRFQAQQGFGAASAAAGMAQGYGQQAQQFAGARAQTAQAGIAGANDAWQTALGGVNQSVQSGLGQYANLQYAQRFFGQPQASQPGPGMDIRSNYGLSGQRLSTGVQGYTPVSFSTTGG